MATYDINKDAEVKVNFTVPGPQGPIGMLYRGDYVAGTTYNYRDGVFNPNNGNSYFWPGPGTTTLEPTVSNGWLMFASRGAIGPQGIQGEKGLVWMGPWSATTVYAVDNAVTYGGSAYRRLVAGTTSTAPDVDNVNWELLASKGDTGTMQTGTTTTGAPGSAASVSNTGTPTHGIFNFTIPEGIQGIQGIQGERGLVWKSAWVSTTAYSVDDAVTHNGSSYRRIVAGTTAGAPSTDTVNWELLSAKGDQGIQGIQGIQGQTGPTGATGLNWRGAWSATADYLEDDAVGYAGASWFANVDPPVGEVPSNTSTYWQLLASQGAVGPQGPQGVQGDQGIQGVQGPQGIQGIQGVQGDIGPTGPAWIINRGEWVSTTAYSVNDSVQNGGSTWRALRANTGVTPIEGLDWTYVAMKGSDGGDAEMVRYTMATALVAGANVAIAVDDLADTITVSSTDTTDPEVVRDTIAAALVGAGATTVTFDDVANTITITSTDTDTNTTDPEVVRDTIAAALVAAGSTTITLDDVANTITISSTDTNTTDPEVVRDTIGAALVAAGATSIVVDDVANTITISSIDTNTTDPEVVRDTIGAALRAAGSTTITLDDVADTITISSTDTNTTDPEVVRDTMAAALVAGTGITLTVDDIADTITVASTGSGSGNAADTEIMAIMGAF